MSLALHRVDAGAPHNPSPGGRAYAHCHCSGRGTRRTTDDAPANCARDLGAWRRRPRDGRIDLMSAQLPLFDRDDEPPPPLPPQAARLAPKLRAMAGRGVYLGTSSWKYEG